MTNIERIREDLYIKKGWDGYRVVYPIRKDITKPLTKDNFHWKNFIGQWHFWLKAAFFLAMVYFIVQQYLADTQQCRDFMSNIDTVCAQRKIISPISNENPPSIDFSNMRLDQNAIKSTDT